MVAEGDLVEDLGAKDLEGASAKPLLLLSANSMKKSLPKLLLLLIPFLRCPFLHPKDSFLLPARPHLLPIKVGCLVAGPLSLIELMELPQLAKGKAVFLLATRASPSAIIFRAASAPRLFFLLLFYLLPHPYSLLHLRVHLERELIPPVDRLPRRYSHLPPLPHFPPLRQVYLK